MSFDWKKADIFFDGIDWNQPWMLWDRRSYDLYPDGSRVELNSDPFFMKISKGRYMSIHKDGFVNIYRMY